MDRKKWDRMICYLHQTTTTTVIRPFFRDHPGEPVPEENFWTLWCKGRLSEAGTQTIRLGDTPSGLTSARLHHQPIFLQAGCPSCRPTKSVNALKAICYLQIRINTRRISNTETLTIFPCNILSLAFVIKRCLTQVSTHELPASEPANISEGQ